MSEQDSASFRIGTLGSEDTSLSSQGSETSIAVPRADRATEVGELESSTNLSSQVEPESFRQTVHTDEAQLMVAMSTSEDPTATLFGNILTEANEVVVLDEDNDLSQGGNQGCSVAISDCGRRFGSQDWSGSSSKQW
jgi:hypothetical protein|eukprot:g14794.t1 g14794   contig90:411193-411603(-)